MSVHEFCPFMLHLHQQLVNRHCSSCHNATPSETECLEMLGVPPASPPSSAGSETCSSIQKAPPGPIRPPPVCARGCFDSCLYRCWNYPKYYSILMQDPWSKNKIMAFAPTKTQIQASFLADNGITQPFTSHVGSEVSFSRHFLRFQAVIHCGPVVLDC